MYAIIVENDESQWDDKAGEVYHFPKRYRELLLPGTQVVYYKGRQRKASQERQRLTAEPHYFGVAMVSKVYADTNSQKGDLFATIDGYQQFTVPVLARDAQGIYIESIPRHRASNFWRDGVRQSDEKTHQRIIESAGFLEPYVPEYASAPRPEPDDQLESWLEGHASYRFVTVYERDPRYRRQAIAIHGYRCAVCDLRMDEVYGEAGKGLIHIHHTVPVSTYDKPKAIDPEKDLVPVCPNCHTIIHRKRESTLSISEARALYLRPSNKPYKADQLEDT